MSCPTPSGERATPGRFWTTLTTSPPVPGRKRTSSWESVRSVISVLARSACTVSTSPEDAAEAGSATSATWDTTPSFTSMPVEVVTCPAGDATSVHGPSGSPETTKRPAASVVA
ncbi:MAG: hypothetical protein Q8P41_11610 [Pseudomonadota bacterium]|nr:hypothetical protein [Pseudomonadota bacterium]